MPPPEEMIANLIPSPLHPAVVHFPVVLILLGAVTALVAVFWRRNNVPLMAAVLLAAGALGAWAAVETGESDGGLLDGGSEQMESLVESHENWAKRALTATAMASLGAVASLFLFRFPRAARATALAVALVAIVAGYAVFETGHRGGALVFRHGAGVNVMPRPVSSVVGLMPVVEKGPDTRSIAGQH